MQWRTVDGYIEIGGAGHWARPTIPVSQYTKRVETWLPLARKSAKSSGAPLAWILGVMFAESGGDPKALSPAGAIGLMQIMWVFHKKCASSKAELYLPRVNVPCGADLLAQSKAKGYDLPASASRYNAGAKPSGKPHPSIASPWGMRENKGYISRVCAAQNFFRARHGSGAGAGARPLVGLLVAVVASTAAYALERSRR